MRGYNLVLLSKKSLLQELVSLPSSDRYLHSAASYQSISQSDVKLKTLRGKNIIVNQDVCSETLDQIEFATDEGVNLLSFVALS